MLVDNQRRKLLELTGTALAAGLAGCGGSNDQQTPTVTGSENGSNDEAAPDAEAQIKFLEQNNIQTIPIVTENNIENKAGVELEVEDQNGLENIRLTYNDQHRDEPFTIYDKARGEFEAGEIVPVSEEFPQSVIAPKTGEFYIEVTDVNGNTKTRTQPIENDLANSFRADRKRTQQGDKGNYSTERNWDNLVTDTEKVQQSHQEWIDGNAYTPLVEKVMSGEDFEAGGRIFPNYNFEGDNNDIGFFDQEAVKNEEDFETLIRWYLPGTMHYDRENHGSAPSSRFPRFAATMEKLINEHHPKAKADSTGVDSLPGHGIFGVQDTKNEEFYLVDTTPASPQSDSAVARINEGFITTGNRSELWEPFHDFEPGPASYGTYGGKSKISMGALMRFTANRDMGDNFDQFFATDLWMDEAYQVLRNGGSIDPIKEPMEELLYNAPELDDNTYIGVYGTLDDTRIAVTTNEEVYNTVVGNPDRTPGTEEIEKMLEAS